jgi:hypothetical protein
MPWAFATPVDSAIAAAANTPVPAAFTNGLRRSFISNVSQLVAKALPM